MSKPEVKVRIRHEYRGIPYEIEFELSKPKQLDLLPSVIDEIIKFIDNILGDENEKQQHEP